MPSTIQTMLTATQMHELKEFGSRISQLGANFAVCDYFGKPALICKSGAFDSDPAKLARIACDCLRHPPKVKSQIDAHTPVSRFLAVPLISINDGKDRRGFAGIIDIGPVQEQQSH